MNTWVQVCYWIGWGVILLGISAGIYLVYITFRGDG